MRNGDLDIYSMDTNGKHVKRLRTNWDTTAAHFSRRPEVDRVSRLSSETDQEIAEYKELLKQKPDPSHHA